MSPAQQAGRQAASQSWFSATLQVGRDWGLIIIRPRSNARNVVIRYTIATTLLHVVLAIQSNMAE
jgi:hypothetical protein